MVYQYCGILCSLQIERERSYGIPWKGTHDILLSAKKNCNNIYHLIFKKVYTDVGVFVPAKKMSGNTQETINSGSSKRDSSPHMLLICFNSLP